MTVAALPATISYIEDGVSTVFAVPFRFKAASDLAVERVSDGNVELLSLGSDYSVFGGGDDSGGTLTRTVATAGAQLRITRCTARSQPMTYTTGDRFPATSHEEALDRQMLISQEQDAAHGELRSRALTLPPGEDATDLPPAAARLGGVMTFDYETGAPTVSPLALFAPGVPGSSDNTYTPENGGLAAFKASDITRATASLVGIPGIADGRFNWTPGDFTGQADDQSTIKADSTPLSQGAWARQRADGVSYTAPGTYPATLPLSVKADQTSSLADKQGDATAQAAAWVTDLITGGEVRIPRGNAIMSDDVTVNRDRVSFIGEGPNATVINFNQPGTAFTFDKSGLGGVYQSTFKNVGFYSTTTDTKTAVAAINAASIDISYLGISTGNWLGAESIGILVQGREFGDIHHNLVSCARPIVVRRNAVWPTLSADHLILRHNHPVGTSALYAAIGFEEGAVLANTTVCDTALVGGKEGVSAINTTEPGASIHFRISNTRREQSLDPNAYSYLINYTGTSLQQLTFDNNRADETQNGLSMGGVIRALITTSAFPQGAGKVAIADVIPAGGSRTLIENSGQVGGVLSITNGHKVFGTRSFATGDPIGPFQHWQYFAAPAVATEGGTADYGALPLLDVGTGRVGMFDYQFPTGTTRLQVPQGPRTVAVDIVARAATGRLEVSILSDGAVVQRSASGIFASSPTDGKISFPDGGGFLANTLPTPTLIRVEVRQ